ncbi:hypothetical protein [Enhygromyxa salina]|uniref:Uncharacterized protein n=1 Tax=Enhygromyxa salina TaxID=215803 RepID=A0A2S9XTY8_9BACT|nr:hypothetical protein [Enhygromyxa salina]PRP96325.1 hypothetical protein ENSA7_71400 [Enhygromyxa salina]
MSMFKPGIPVVALAGALCTACPADDDASTSHDDDSMGASAGEMSLSGDMPSSDTAPNTESESGEGESGEGESGGGESGGGETGEGETGEGETGEGEAENGVCPSSPTLPHLRLTGAIKTLEGWVPIDETSCDLPAVASFDFEYEGGTPAAHSCNSEENPQLQFQFRFGLPNNNWEPEWNEDSLYMMKCVDMYFFTEPAGDDTCRLARVDIVDPDNPELPIYSVGSTLTHLDENGLALEAINPVPCESNCAEGELYDLRFATADGEAVIDAQGFPWTHLESGGKKYRAIRFDAMAVETSEVQNHSIGGEDGEDGGDGEEDPCEDAVGGELVSWAMVLESDPDLEPSDSGGAGNPEPPGSCLGEIDSPQPDLFVGDGVADMELRLWTIDSEPPVELQVGAHVHVQGSFEDCCDDDISVKESVVVRAYPSERFILGLVDSHWHVPPTLPGGVLAAIGETFDSWLHPFELSARDDLLCSKKLWSGAVRTRMSVQVDAGECESAKIVDEDEGAFADVFFVAAGDMDSWFPNGQNVDSISHSAVFISRQSCEPGECPETANSYVCPPDSQVQDRAYMSFAGYDYEPDALGYDHVCEILAIGDDGQRIDYELDCGGL